MYLGKNLARVRALSRALWVQHSPPQISPILLWRHGQLLAAGLILNLNVGEFLSVSSAVDEDIALDAHTRVHDHRIGLNIADASCVDLWEPSYTHTQG